MTRILLATRPSEIESLRASILAKNYEVVAYETLENALDGLKKMDFQVAVIDDNFDGSRTGWILADKIRSYYGQDPVIIVIDTSQRFNAYFSDKALVGKFDWVISTPFSAEELLVKVEFHLNKRQQKEEK